MCFAPQGRELFRHLNFQKCSGIPVFCTSWLSNVLRATTVCTFSTSQLPKVVRIWGALYILTSKCTSHHKGVHFFDISTSKTGPRMVCLVHFDFQTCFAPQRRAASSLIWPDGSAPVALASLLFDPPEPQIIGKTVFRGFPTFSRICIFFLLTLSLLLFSLLIFLFSLPLPCFSSVHIVGSLTSKLPSNTVIINMIIHCIDHKNKQKQSNGQPLSSAVCFMAALSKLFQWQFQTALSTSETSGSP